MKKQLLLVLLFGLTVSSLLTTVPLHSAPDSFMAKLCSYVPVKACVGTGLGLLGLACCCKYKMSTLDAALKSINEQSNSIPPKREYPMGNHRNTVWQLKQLKYRLDECLEEKNPQKNPENPYHFRALSIRLEDNSFLDLIGKQELIGLVDAQIVKNAMAVERKLQSFNALLGSATDRTWEGFNENYSKDKADILEYHRELHSLFIVLSQQLSDLIMILKNDEALSKKNKRAWDVSEEQHVQDQVTLLASQRGKCIRKAWFYSSCLGNLSKVGVSLLALAAVGAYWNNK